MTDPGDRGPGDHSSGSSAGSSSGAKPKPLIPRVPAKTVPAPAPAAQTEVSLSIGLGTLDAGRLPLLFTVQAQPSATGELTVKLDFTGPGLPASDTFSVAPGKSVTHTFTVGCGSWKVRVASVNGKAVDASGNPALENGATHLC